VPSVHDPLGSTSWHNRHLACFQEFNSILLREGVSHLSVMVVGPGAVTSLAAPLLNDAARSSASRLRKLVGDAARYGDQLLRRVPGLPLRSLEPAELSANLSMPHDLIVVDRSRRILEAVRRHLPTAECHLVDISFQAIPVTADVVVAFNVICRLAEPVAGLARVAAAVKPGGWLLIDDRSADAHIPAHPAFHRVARKIHRRVDADSTFQQP